MPCVFETFPGLIDTLCERDVSKPIRGLFNRSSGNERGT